MENLGFLLEGGGSVINVASFVATMGAATPQIAYTSSKGAVVAMTREIATIYALGAVDCVFKPFAPDVLKAKVCTFIDLARQAHDLRREIGEVAVDPEAAHRVHGDDRPPEV